MKKETFIEKEEQVSPKQERDRLDKWPKVGIRLEKIMRSAGRMEDVARLLREDESYADMYTIEEQVQRASDRIRASIRDFEKQHQVKIEIFTPYSPFEDNSSQFIPNIKKPEEMSE
jgi:hypothetical protein